MLIHFMREDDLNFFKTNVANHLAYYAYKDNHWIQNILDHDPLIPFKKDIIPFTLDPEADDVDNAKILYGAMKELSDSDATDERIWAGLNHGILWEFMRKHVESSLDANTRLKWNENLISNRFFYTNNGVKRSIYINTLSKMWWIGRLTYDKDLPENPYASMELFRTAFSHKLINTFSSNFMANPVIRFGLFDAALSLKSQGVEIKGDTMVPLLKHLNELGGTMVLDLFSRDEIRDKLMLFSKNHLRDIKNR